MRCGKGYSESFHGALSAKTQQTWSFWEEELEEVGFRYQVQHSYCRWVVWGHIVPVYEIVRWEQKKKWASRLEIKLRTYCTGISDFCKINNFYFSFGSKRHSSLYGCISRPTHETYKDIAWRQGEPPIFIIWLPTNTCAPYMLIFKRILVRKKHGCVFKFAFLIFFWKYDSQQIYENLILHR